MGDYTGVKGMGDGTMICLDCGYNFSKSGNPEWPLSSLEKKAWPKDLRNKNKWSRYQEPAEE